VGRLPTVEPAQGTAEDVARHGVREPRGQRLPEELRESGERQGLRGGRFGRMLSWLPHRELHEDSVEQIATALTALAGTSNDSTSVVAGYTYFGQFVDHDITFDPTSKLERVNDPFALRNFRTPRFDLDSLYGSGPDDQPFLYDWEEPPKGVKLLVGRNPGKPAGSAADDLPRNEDGRALIGDARNDENLVIAQLHLLFMRFHNKVVDYVGKGSQRDRTELFAQAQRVVRWHYQWIVLRDFLPKVAGEEARALGRRFYTWRDAPFMPVEFSGAAYRFGHSMVREDYRLNDAGPNVTLFDSDGGGEDLRGFRWLPAALEIEWKHFFKTAGTSPQMSKRIDPSLSRALAHVPPTQEPLARLNLKRGLALGLPAGRDVAEAMGETPLSADDLLEPFGDRIDGTCRDELVRATPLWYYVLREAELRGGGGLHLGPVGGRIVAEVLLGLLEGDPNSYLRQWPAWEPDLPTAHDGTFTMPDLVDFALNWDVG
jgi:Animal haem peroxidase